VKSNKILVFGFLKYRTNMASMWPLKTEKFLKISF